MQAFPWWWGTSIYKKRFPVKKNFIYRHPPHTTGDAWTSLRRFATRKQGGKIERPLSDVPPTDFIRRLFAFIRRNTLHPSFPHKSERLSSLAGLTAFSQYLSYRFRELSGNFSISLSYRPDFIVSKEFFFTPNQRLPKENHPPSAWFFTRRAYPLMPPATLSA